MRQGIRTSTTSRGTQICQAMVGVLGLILSLIRTVSRSASVRSILAERQILKSSSAGSLATAMRTVNSLRVDFI